MVQLFLEIATALRSQDQFVALGGSRGIGDRAIQFPTRASDFLVAADNLDEAWHRDHPFGTRVLFSLQV